MVATGVREEDILRLGAAAPGLRDAVFAVATRASDHLITARQMLHELRAGRAVGHAYEHEGEEGHIYEGKESHTYDIDVKGDGWAKDVERAFGALMPAVATGLWLERLEKVNFNVFDEGLRGREWRLPWRAYWAWRRRVF